MVSYIKGLLSSDVFQEVNYKVVRSNNYNKEKYQGFVRLLLNILNAFILTVTFVFKAIIWRPDIVHIQSNSGFGYFEKSWIALLARGLGSKTILHFHGGNFLNFYKESNRLKRKLIKQCAMINNRLMTGSPQMKDNWLSIGVPKSKIVYIGNAVDMPDVTQRPPRTSVTILFLTRVVLEKGIIELIDAFLQLKSSYVDLKLRIVGADSLDTPLVKKYLLKKDPDQSINYIGPVTDEQKRLEYLNADIFAFPTYVEDQSYAIMEAMSYGLPCVASNVGGVPSLITDGKNGLLIEPKDVQSLKKGLETLISDLELRKLLGENASRTIRDGFTWKIRSQEIKALYETLVSE